MLSIGASGQGGVHPGLADPTSHLAMHCGLQRPPRPAANSTASSVYYCSIASSVQQATSGPAVPGAQACTSGTTQAMLARGACWA